jgi:hypothetical protein
MSRVPSSVLVVLALIASVIGYLVTSSVMAGLDLPDGARTILLLVVPLAVAGLCMVPFVIPVFDRMAKRDLAAHRAAQAAQGIQPAADPDESPPA